VGIISISLCQNVQERMHLHPIHESQVKTACADQTRTAYLNTTTFNTERTPTMSSSSAKQHEQKLKTPGTGGGESIHPWAVTVEAPQDVSPV
jgi:hypothetical protein